MSTTVTLSEALKMRDQLTREWRTQGLRPTLEDIALRAVARALAELPGDLEGTVSLSQVVDGVAEVRALPGAAFRPFRDAVNALPDGEAAPVGCIVTSYLDTAIEVATPRLLQGHRIAVALGAERQQPAWTGDFVPTPVSMISIAFEAATIGDAEAATFIARVRELMESPYALLAD
jgi:pyruvate/2-oxoglutarate dehydrogenase complex dihydrolipoamide acyltransferase (E2) component